MQNRSNELIESDTDLLANKLAQRLLDVYLTEQVPAMVQEFASAGFSRGLLIRDIDALYRMVIIAAYDRTPFTRGTGGYEQIWEIAEKGKGVPSLLSSVGLWSIDMARNTTKHEIKSKLSGLRLGGIRMDKYGPTRFDDTIVGTCRRMTPDFHRQLILADSPQAIKDAFLYFTNIHGIAETIASKLIMYLLREIAIGRARPSDFPSSVTRHLVKEYHAGKAAVKLGKLSSNLVQKTAKILVHQGDAYAVDALFYMQRTMTSEFNDLIDELSISKSNTSEIQFNSTEKQEANVMSYAKYHDKLAEVMSNHKGRTLNSRQIKGIFEDSYPQFDKKWVQPSDHCIDHTCKGACDCALTDRALFSRPKYNTYIVL